VEREERDRTSLELPGQQNELIDTVLATGAENIIIAITTAGPVSMANYSHTKQVAAILDCIYLGQTAVSVHSTSIKFIHSSRSSLLGIGVAQHLVWADITVRSVRLLLACFHQHVLLDHGLSQAAV
jgi:hypothetical protein